MATIEIEMALPTETRHGFVPQGNFGVAFGCYVHDYPSQAGDNLLWAIGQPNASAELRRDLVRWFRDLPHQGRRRYKVLFRLELENGAFVSFTSRDVSAPLSPLELNAILQELGDKITTYEGSDERPRPVRLWMSVWHRTTPFDGVQLVGDGADASGADAGANAALDVASRASAGASASTGRQRGTSVVHHRSGPGRGAERLTSLQRCVAIALYPTISHIEKKDSAKQRKIALALFEDAQPLQGEAALAQAERVGQLCVDVYNEHGEVVRASAAEHSRRLDVVRTGDEVYRYVTSLADLLGKNKACKWCGRWYEKLREHEEGRSCLKCDRCKAKFDSRDALERHRETCDAHDSGASLPDKFLRRANEHWFVWDIESIKGEASRSAGSWRRKQEPRLR